MNQEYVRGAIARGVSKSKILFSHILRNAWLPIVTLIGIYFGVFLSGAAIVETIFFMARYWTAGCRSCRQKRLPCNTSDYFLWLGVIYVAVNFWWISLTLFSRSACADWKGE